MIRLIIILFLITIFIAIAKTKLQPFPISDDLAFESNFKKRAIVNTNDTFFPSLIRYSSESAKLLSLSKENDLQEFRCSDSFIRTNQGVYILESVKTSQKDKKRVKNESFIEFMRNKEKNLPKGKKILTARICQTKNKTLFILYSIGMYDSKSADNTPIYQTILNSTFNDAFIQIFPNANLIGSRIFNLDRSNSHLRCDEPFRVDINNLLYVLCSEESAKSANYQIYAVDLNTGRRKLIGKCLNNFSEKLLTICS